MSHKQNFTSPTFTLSLEFVREYKYLGILISTDSKPEAAHRRDMCEGQKVSGHAVSEINFTLYAHHGKTLRNL